MKRRQMVKRLLLIAITLMATVASADVAPPPGELETEGIWKSLQSPECPSFWFLWDGMIAILLAVFFMRRYLRVAVIGFGVVMLIIGLVTGAKNYGYCGRCGTKLERWYDGGRHVGCPTCDVCPKCGSACLRRGYSSEGQFMDCGNCGYHYYEGVKVKKFSDEEVKNSDGEK